MVIEISSYLTRIYIFCGFFDNESNIIEAIEVNYSYTGPGWWWLWTGGDLSSHGYVMLRHAEAGLLEILGIHNGNP